MNNEQSLEWEQNLVFHAHLLGVLKPIPIFAAFVFDLEALDRNW